MFALGHPGGRVCPPPHETAGAPDDDNGYWVLPAADQERQILADWAAFVPHPVFDHAYSWGSQLGDTALSQSLSVTVARPAGHLRGKECQRDAPEQFLRAALLRVCDARRSRPRSAMLSVRGRAVGNHPFGDAVSFDEYRDAASSHEMRGC